MGDLPQQSEPLQSWLGVAFPRHHQFVLSLASYLGREAVDSGLRVEQACGKSAAAENQRQSERLIQLRLGNLEKASSGDSAGALLVVARA
jgi:hypothetical protein